MKKNWKIVHPWIKFIRTACFIRPHAFYVGVMKRLLNTSLLSSSRRTRQIPSCREILGLSSLKMNIWSCRRKVVEFKNKKKERVYKIAVINLAVSWDWIRMMRRIWWRIMGASRILFFAMIIINFYLLMGLDRAKLKVFLIASREISMRIQ